MYCLDSRDIAEQSYASGNYEVIVEKIGEQEDLPKKLPGIEANESLGLDSQECGEAVHNLSSAGVVLSGSSESQTLLPDIEDPCDGQVGCEEYACSSCGITFSSVMEHIRMYHGGQEVVIEVCVDDLVICG